MAGTPRSVLFSPGVDERKLAKAQASGCALVIADLEDGVVEHEKGRARDVVAAVFAGPRSGAARAIRINGSDTQHLEADLALLAQLELDAVVVPKASPEFVSELAGRAGAPLIPVVETAAGVQRSADVAAAEGVWALMLGGVDLARELRLVPRDDGLHLLATRSKLVVDSAAAGIAAPIDTPFTRIRALDALAAEAALARSLGFGGKACIHPDQIPVVEEAFAATSTEIEWAARVVREFETASRDGTGATDVDGEMVDLPVYERARRLVADAESRARS